MNDKLNDKIILGVDLDECVFGYLPAISNHMGIKGFKVPTEPPAAFSMVENGWFETMELFRQTHGDAVENGLYEHLEVFEGASEILKDLSKSGYEINIITSRFVNPGQHGLVVAQTAIALDKNNIPYSSLSFLDNKTRFLADAYIDDGPHNLEPLQKLGRYTITFDQAYNRHIPGPRVNSWHEAREVLQNEFGR